MEPDSDTPPHKSHKAWHKRHPKATISIGVVSSVALVGIITLSAFAIWNYRNKKQKEIFDNILASALFKYVNLCQQISNIQQIEALATATAYLAQIPIYERLDTLRNNAMRALLKLTSFIKDNQQFTSINIILNFPFESISNKLTLTNIDNDILLLYKQRYLWVPRDSWESRPKCVIQSSSVADFIQQFAAKIKEADTKLSNRPQLTNL
jgi:hypothetical protein